MFMIINGSVLRSFLHDINPDVLIKQTNGFLFICQFDESFRSRDHGSSSRCVSRKTVETTGSSTHQFHLIVKSKNEQFRLDKQNMKELIKFLTIKNNIMELWR